MNNEKMKPCPFCGSTDIVVVQRRGGGYEKYGDEVFPYNDGEIEFD